MGSMTCARALSISCHGSLMKKKPQNKKVPMHSSVSNTYVKVNVFFFFFFSEPKRNVFCTILFYGEMLNWVSQYMSV